MNLKSWAKEMAKDKVPCPECGKPTPRISIMAYSKNDSTKMCSACFVAICENRSNLIFKRLK